MNMTVNTIYESMGRLQFDRFRVVAPDADMLMTTPVMTIYQFLCNGVVTGYNLVVFCA